MKPFDMEETARAREEFKKQLVNLSTVVSESVSATAKTALSGTMDLVDSRVRSSLAQLDPRHFIRKRPLTTIAGAFLTGLVVSSRRGLAKEIMVSGVHHPFINAATNAGADLLRAYGLSIINRKNWAESHATDT